MRRLLLNYLLPIALPFIIYGVGLLLARRKARLAGADGVPEWRDAPLTWLLIASALLVAASFVALALTSGSPPGGTYVAPQYIDGVIVPGRTE